MNTVAQVVSLQDSRDTGFDNLRESVRVLTGDHQTLLQDQEALEDDQETLIERVGELETDRYSLTERVSQLETENTALLRFSAALHQSDRLRLQQFDTAFRSLWVRYLNLLATVRNNLEASEIFAEATEANPLARSFLRAARDSVPDESQPANVTAIPEAGNPYVGAELVLEHSSVLSSELILPPSTGETLLTLHRAGVGLREVFAARLTALRNPRIPLSVDLTNESDSDSQARLDRLFDRL